MAEERLWAAWRLDYIEGHCLGMLDAYPYNNGHLMVSPTAHTASLEDLADDQLLELMQLTRRSLGALGEAYAGFDDHVFQ
jgi:diadenosine tetraphosphate (Ap4A) HIT family hydrolase